MRAAIAEQLAGRPWYTSGSTLQVSRLTGPRVVLIGDAAHAGASHARARAGCRCTPTPSFLPSACMCLGTLRGLGQPGTSVQLPAFVHSV